MTAIAGSTLPLAPVTADGTPMVDAPATAWERELRRLKACGFDSFDLVDGWVRVDRLPHARVGELRIAAEAAGLEIAGVSVIRASVIDPSDGNRNVERTLQAVDAAAKLGAGIVGVGFHRPLSGRQLEAPFWMVPHARDRDDDDTFALAALRLRRVCRHAAQHGIAITLELHESTLLDRSSRVLRLLAAVDAENLGVNLDIGNLIRTPFRPAEPWRQTVTGLASHVNYWHLKNYVRLEDPATDAALTAPCALGDGELDYRWALAEVLAHGYAGPLCIEHYGGDALWAMTRGREYIQALLTQMEARR